MTGTRGLPTGGPGTYRVLPVFRPIDTVAHLPGSKSITNRALLLAALAEGTSVLKGVLFADDTEAMLDAVARLGADLDIDRAGCTVSVTGIGGLASSRPQHAELFANQSGTTSRFLLPVLAALPGVWTLDGDPQLRARPFDDQIVALERLGGRVEALGEPGRLPMSIPGASLGGGVVEVAGDASSQFLSGLLMAGPLFSQGLVLRVGTELVSRPYVDMTVAVMRAFGADVTDSGPHGTEWIVAAGGYCGTDYEVEPDASAASYAFAAAAVTRGRVAVPGLSHRSLQGGRTMQKILDQKESASGKEASHGQRYSVFLE